MLDPTTPTVGASGAIFGILGAGLVMEQVQRDYVFGGSALGVIVLNLVFTFSVSNISIGGHIGGLLGGLWMVKIGINRALWLFGIVQVVSILGFAWLAYVNRPDRVLLAVVIAGGIGA